MHVLYQWPLKRSRLHACCTASTQRLHSGSNSTGLVRYCGKRRNISFFSVKSSVIGNPGRSRSPAGVHCRSTLSPNSASLVSFTARVGALHSPFSFGYFRMTSSILCRLSLSITEDGKEFPFEIPSGKGSAPVCS